MGLHSSGEILSCVALAVLLAACAGLRAWLPLLLAGVMARLGMLELGPTFHALESNRALVLLACVTLVEIAADKIPVLDHTLDALSTFVRPLAGAALAAAVLGRISDPLVSIVLGTVVGVPAAMAPHVAKAGLRTASTALTAGIGNPFLSLFEDGFTFVVVVLAVLIPVVVLGALLLLGSLVLRRATRGPAADPA